MGRSFGTVNAGFNMPDLHNLILQVISTFIPIERPVRVRTGKSYFLRITPYRTIENKVEGAVLTLTLALTDKQRGEAAAAQHPTEFMLVLDPELRIKAATSSFYRTLRVSPESVQNRPIQSLNHMVSDNPQLEEALQKAQNTNEAIAPFMVELRTDKTPRKFECKLERIALAGGTSLIAVSMLAPFTDQQRLQAGT
jgi:two-component system, chemotaxis family, CheB/CheR fusion protein